MVLFGKEFDADERAEVGGGLRGVEGDEDAGSVGRGGFAITLREDGGQQLVRV
jgi:hypothetical protein